MDFVSYTEAIYQRPSKPLLRVNPVRLSKDIDWKSLGAAGVQAKDIIQKKKSISDWDIGNIESIVKTLDYILFDRIKWRLWVLTVSKEHFMILNSTEEHNEFLILQLKK